MYIHMYIAEAYILLLKAFRLAEVTRLCISINEISILIFTICNNGGNVISMITIHTLTFRNSFALTNLDMLMSVFNP